MYKEQVIKNVDIIIETLKNNIKINKGFLKLMNKIIYIR